MLKKKCLVLGIIAISLLGLVACGNEEVEETTVMYYEFETAEEVKAYLLEGNENYQSDYLVSNGASEEVRTYTAENGQMPYAVVVTCSDSRVVPEYIFDTGINELFVISNAGNVIGDYDLGSVEYGVEHLGCKLVVILGHESCGAVAATIEGGVHGYMESFVTEISSAIGDTTDTTEAEYLNIQNSIDECMKSDIVAEAVESGEVKIVGAYYSITDGSVTFIE